MLWQLKERPLRLQSESPKCRKRRSSVATTMQSQVEQAAATQRVPILPPSKRGQHRVSIPQGLQNGLATGVMREPLPIVSEGAQHLQPRPWETAFWNDPVRFSWVIAGPVQANCPCHQIRAGDPPFTHSSDLRHLQIEAGIHTIGEAAWQHCTRLLIVHLPSTALCLKREPFDAAMCSIQSPPRGVLTSAAGLSRSAIR